MVLRKNIVKYFAVLFSLVILSSCSPWENFTTYFNLYYNTATLFNDAETEILNQKRDLFSNEPLVLQGNSRNALVKVIEKSSKILQFDANSSFVDEALMMLGKSFFYQGNFQKAKRKFEELLATNPDDDEEVLEANLWIAKCMFALKENTDASKLIEKIRLKAVEEGYDKLIKESYVEEIKYYLRQENYPGAISLANDFADVYDDNATRAEVYFELGKLYTLTGDNANAILAYEKVFDNSPDFDLEIAATINYADALREAGENEKALSVFEDIRTKDKFSNSFNEIDFEIGKTLVQLGRYNQAYDQFRMVDSTYKNTPFASAANFEIAELYRTHFANYDSSAYFYSKSILGNLPKDYVDKAKNKNQLFIKYNKFRKDINKFNRQLYYTENPEIFSKDSAAYLADSLAILNDFLAKKELQDIWKTTDTNTPQLVYDKNIDSAVVRHSIIVKDSLKKVDSLIQIGLYNPPDSIGLKQRIRNYLVDTFVKDTLHKVDSLVKIGRIIPQDTIGLRLKIKNLIVERSKSTFDSKDARQNKLAQLLQNPGQARLDTVKFKRNPPLKLKISVDSAKTILAKNNFELGNLFLAELDVPDSAYQLYSTILKDYPSTTYYPNTLYALGSYYLTVNNKTKADSLFRIIYDNYKDKSIVNAAANKLNLPLIDLSFDPAKDKYASAENLMLGGNYDQSVNQFFNIYKDYPKSPFAPQALYASGWILENNLSKPDSAASVYDLLVSKYPASVYVKNVNKKLVTYKQEKARIQKAIQDSLALAQRLKTDSSLVASNVTTHQLNKLDENIVDKVEQNQNVPEQKTNVAQVNNINTQKKLEPLWDPRKHFQ